jgi:hypothetical protein
VAFPPVNTIYSVLVTDTNGCVANDSVSVILIPHLSISSDTTICKGNSVNLFSSGGALYQWTPSDFLTDTIVANPVSTPDTTITYVLTIDTLGCTAIDSVKISVNSLPVVGLSNDTSICSGNSVPLLATGGVSYVWTPSTGLSNDTISNPTADPISTTTYIVSVSAINGCSNVDSVEIAINQNPIAVAGSDTLICHGVSIQLLASGGLNYSWQPTTGLTNSNISAPYASPATTTVYTLTVSDINGCVGSDELVVQVDSCLGISETGNSKISILLYPNPFSESVTISLISDSSISKSLSFEMIDVLGKVVLTVPIRASQQRINNQSLTAGIYFWRVKQINGKLLATGKVLID